MKCEFLKGTDLWTFDVKGQSGNPGLEEMLDLYLSAEVAHFI